MPEAKQLVTFWLDDFLFGIDVKTVQEIIRTQRLTRVPLADPSIRGLINLRGQIVTVVDLKQRLGFRAADAVPRDAHAMNVVVRTEGGPISFQVDRIGDVLDVDDSMFEPPPATVKQSARELLEGIYKLKDRFLHVLSVERAVAFRSRVQPASSTAWTPTQTTIAVQGRE